MPATLTEQAANYQGIKTIIDNGDGTGKVAVDAVFEAGDIEIGAVEIKDGATDTRTKVGVGTAIAEADNAVAVKDPVNGVTTGAAVTTDANGTIQQYLRGLIKLLVAGALSLVKAEDAAHASGDIGVMALARRADTATSSSGTDGDYSTLNTDAAGRLHTVNPDLTNFGAGEYETVVASQVAQVIGSTGAVGDFIAGLLVIPETTSPDGIYLLDNATAIAVFTGGASSVSNLVPFFIPLGMKSVSGAWKVTTGANVSVIAIGNFT